MEMSNSEKQSSGFKWIENPNQVGEMLFTFDGKYTFNLFRDYPHKLTDEQRRLFDEETHIGLNFLRTESRDYFDAFYRNYLNPVKRLFRTTYRNHVSDSSIWADVQGKA